jgi:hypothetical protein
VAVAVLATAGMAIVIAFQNMAGQYRMATVHGRGGETARTIAEAGLHRAMAYLDKTFENGGNLDQALDPDWSCNCADLSASGPSAITSCSNKRNRPDFTDGSHQSFEGKGWTKVAYEEGAYLIRIEDNFDDYHDVSTFPTLLPTTNDKADAGGCLEGPLASPDGVGGVDNPVRDRDRTLWVYVLGVHPGTDPTKATEVVRMRKLFARIGSPPGIQMKGNISITGSGDFKACSPIAGALIEGDIDSGRSEGCVCGESEYGGTKTGTWSAPCTTCPNGCVTSATLTDTNPEAVPAGTPFGSDADNYFDWSRQCLFYIDNRSTTTPVKNTLWFWDATAPRGPGHALCNSAEGADVDWTQMTPPDPSQAGTASATAWRGCWTPLLGRMDGSCDPFVDSERSQGGGQCHWQPNRSDVVTNIGINDATYFGSGCSMGQKIPDLLTAAGYSQYPCDALLRFNKPNWESACTVADPFASGTPRKCETCDGLNNAVTHKVTGPFLNLSSANNIRAIPAGVYIIHEAMAVFDVVFDAYDGASTTPPTLAPNNTPVYPLATLALPFSGALTFKRNLLLGIGQKSGSSTGDTSATYHPYPSVIGGGGGAATSLIMSTGDNGFAGNMYLYGTFSHEGPVGKDTYYFGEIHMDGPSGGSLNVNGGGDFVWIYNTRLSLSSAPPVPPAMDTF